MITTVIKGVEKMNGGLKISYIEGDYGTSYASPPTMSGGEDGDVVIAKNTKAGETGVHRYEKINGVWYYVALTAVS